MDRATSPASAEHEYHDRVNPDLLKLLPLDARLIVETGCGTGALGAEYIRLNPAVTYVGIERDEAAGRRARARLAQVEIADAEEVDLAAIGIERGTVDCLVYGDVLEHLLDPWQLVARHAEWLSPKGIVVACIPNVQHWTVLLNLLAGEWRYASEGLLDRTHLRWFTRESIIELFRSAGLIVAAIQRRVIPDNRFDLFVEAMKPALASLHVDRALFEQDASTLQYVVTARLDPGRSPPAAQFGATSGTQQPRQDANATPLTHPGEPPIEPQGRGQRLFLHHVLTYRGAVDALNHHRIRAPAAALARRPGVSCCVEGPGKLRLVSESAGDKVLILQRIALIADGIASLRIFLGKGYTLVMDFDDHPDYNPLVAENLYLSFRAVHGVQVTSGPLAALIRTWNPEVAVFPSTIAELGPLLPRGDPSEVTICFAAFNREADWAPIIAHLNRTIAAISKPVHVVVVFDRAFFDAVETPRKTFRSLLSYAEYLDVLKHADIVLMPLEDTEFNRCKSDLKFLEAGACGAVALASHVVYGGSIRNWDTGVVFTSPDEFAGALARLIEDAALRQRLSQQAYRYVAEERQLDGQVVTRELWYRSLVARRHELTAALLARVPELA
jgi:SAM-dependent methyltransferase